MVGDAPAGSVCGPCFDECALLVLGSPAERGGALDLAALQLPGWQASGPRRSPGLLVNAAKAGACLGQGGLAGGLLAGGRAANAAAAACR